jgi:HAD domain family 1 in Swiss Army Knife RNA repair proteins
MQQKDALTVLLTGRGETNFADLLNRIVRSKSLDFDLVVLKPEVGPNGQRFGTTMDFKQEFLRDLIFTYKTADEMRIYEDRPKHTKGFREFSEKLNKSLLSHPIDQPPPLRKPITTEVIQVADLGAYLDPTTECAAVQRIIDRHNIAITSNEPNLTRSPSPRMQIKKNFVYFGYLINATDSARLLTLANIQPPTLIDTGEIRLMASSILISPRPAPRSLLNQVGGFGKKVTWQVTGTAVFEGRIWAARLAPVPETEKYYTPDQNPFVVLALRKGAAPIEARRIQNWQPVPPEKAFIFETVVGDKVFLEIVPETRNDGNVGFRGGSGTMQNAKGGGNFKRKYGDDNGYKGKEDLARSGSRNGERDEGTWIPKDNNGYDSYSGSARQGASGDRHGQGRHFNQMQGQNEGRNFSGGRGGGNSNRGGRGGGDTRRSNHQSYGGGGNVRGGSRANDRGRGGGGGGKGRGGGSRNGPAGYKSLDDYGSGPGGYDGAGDFGSRGTGAGAGGGDVVMNY